MGTITVAHELHRLPTMRLLDRHKAIINTAFALLFFITNSGFTAIVASCRDSEMQEMSCCAADVKGSNKRCDCGRNGTSTANGLSYQENSACHTNKVVGGSLNLQALLEKSLSGSKEKLFSSVVLLFVDSTADFAQQTNTHLLLSDLLSISPPSVEKCVLHSTFLI